eukprot:TRINITY_DN847_c0_g2_i1.p1 TRINITY_DN847_c0_g2~~TRINITY_DN847_c0_g2_i1.p1  ORF type:complete len:1047 (+),score=309.79 TRINITY_DN847_c0_g2_i1:218-3142(+)
MCLNEFVSKKERLSTDFYITVSSESSPEFEYEIMMCAPLWMYNFQPTDIISLRKRNEDSIEMTPKAGTSPNATSSAMATSSTAGSSSQQKSFDEDDDLDSGVIQTEAKVARVLKVGTFAAIIRPESNSNATISTESMKTVRDLLQAVCTSGDWTCSHGDEARGIPARHIKYYELSLVTPDALVSMNEDELLTKYNFMNLQLLILRRKSVIEITLKDAPPAFLNETKTHNRTTKIEAVNPDPEKNEDNRAVGSFCFMVSSIGPVELIGKEILVSLQSLCKRRKQPMIKDKKETEKKTFAEKWSFSALYHQGNHLNPVSDLNSATIAIGDLLDVHFAVDGSPETPVVKFNVTYIPTMDLSTDPLAFNCSVHFEGEKLLFGPAIDVKHIFTQVRPGWQFSGPQSIAQMAIATTKGYAYVTNYQTIFHSYDELPEGQVMIPHGMLEKIEKFGRKSGADEGYTILLTCKDGRTMRLAIPKDSKNTRKNFVNTIKEYAFCMKDIEKFFCFSYKPSFPSIGWNFYNVEKEMQRLGAGGKSGWRICKINEDYSVCDTYPGVVCVPELCDDDLVRACAQYRSRQRFPTLSWRHQSSGATITRCSQPKVGLTGATSPKDEAFLNFILQSNTRNMNNLYILDSRPKANAVANRARGGGYEDVSNYPNTFLSFENIPNIHVIRNSLNACKNAFSPEVDEDTGFYSLVEQSQWLNLMKVILLSVSKTVHYIDHLEASVVVHCSDGWDRTAQCTSLAELCLDPYYRTIEGFIVLIEKEWLSIGHRFGTRHGHGDEKLGEQRAPIFIQFLDLAHQIISQFPNEFEFSIKLLLELYLEVHNCKFGTFLFDCERERKEAKLPERTPSFWSYVLFNKASFMNPTFRPGMRVLYPDCSIRNMRLWKELFLRWHNAMEAESPTKQTRDLYNSLQSLTQVHSPNLSVSPSSSELSYSASPAPFSPSSSATSTAFSSKEHKHRKEEKEEKKEEKKE